MMTTLQRQDAVVAQPRGAAPDHHIAVSQRHPALPVRAGIGGHGRPVEGSQTV